MKLNLQIVFFQKADLAAAPLTISSMRMKVVDFTHPYMNLGKFCMQ